MQNLTAATALEICCERVRQNIASFGDQFPFIGDGDKYVLGANDHWMTSFWTGELWLAYVLTQDEAFRQAAEEHLISFRRRLNDRIDISHDLGFLYTLTARAHWQLTGDETAHQLALDAANALVERFHEKGQYIQAWGEIGDPQKGGQFIVDCMMNIPLLYWAGSQTGNSRYADIANAHTVTNIRYIVREDGSTAHTFLMDQASGEPIGQKTHQGYSDDSLWARGQAWAIYGFALAYSWSENEAFLQTAIRCADRFLVEITPDYIPLWDFRLPPNANRLRDTSAGSIAAMGMLRIASLTTNAEQSARYTTEAQKLINTLLHSAFDTRSEGIQGLLKDATYHATKPDYTEQYTLFGDYFFFEALMHLSGTMVDLWGKDKN